MGKRCQSSGSLFGSPLSTSANQNVERLGYDEWGASANHTAHAILIYIDPKMLYKYEGTPHGNAKLTYSKIILILNLISFFL